MRSFHSTGEGVERTDDDIWRLNYCEQNVSNTPSTLLAELRPVDYSGWRASGKPRRQGVCRLQP